MIKREHNDLSIEKMLPYLPPNIDLKKILIYDSLASTNNTAKEMAANGCSHGTVIIANHQTAGRGRYGRSFHSPSGSGLYMSIILHAPLLKLPDISSITAVTAVIVCRAIQTVCRKYAMIKWVNDILLNNKKIGGILIEATSAHADQIVVGIGINVSTTDFPADLREKAGSIMPREPSSDIRSRLSAEILVRLTSENALSDMPEIVAEYKKRQVLLGRTITVHHPNETFYAQALDIDDHFNLLVKDKEGAIRTLSFGEVSIDWKSIQREEK